MQRYNIIAVHMDSKIIKITIKFIEKYQQQRKTNNKCLKMDLNYAENKKLESFNKRNGVSCNSKVGSE